MIEKLKNYYYSKLSHKLSNKATSSKAYWSIPKTFLNDKNIPCIPPVCSLPTNNSELPKDLLFLTEKRLSHVQISNENIIKIINNLEPNKDHRHDMISIRMSKLCGPSLCEPLSIIFKSCLSRMKFHMEWKKANVVPIHKKKKKMINTASKTTGLLLCFRSAVRFLKDFYLTNCTSFLMKMTYYHPTSQAFDPATLA